MPPSKNPLAKHWAFTLNNYTDADIITELPEGVSYYLAGQEVATTGTRHLQGHISLLKKKRLPFLRKIHPRAHFSVVKDLSGHINYCKKEATGIIEIGTVPTEKGTRTDIEEFKRAVKGGLYDLNEVREGFSSLYARCPRFCLEYITQHRPKPVIPEYALYQWQEDLVKVLDSPVDPRRIIFRIDITGNAGKSYFADWYCQKYEDAVILEPGKKSDLSYVFSQITKTPRVVFYDCPRVKIEHMSYEFLESLKNGRMMVSKYESRMYFFERPHVVVFMNDMPCSVSLSADRYDIEVICRDE